MALQEHQQLRQRYSARLLWSGDWSTFSDADFWVTIAGIRFPNSAGALAWCRDKGFDRDHCVAKLVSTTHPVAGSTAYNN
jgi:serine/threonine kinase PknH